MAPALCPWLVAKFVQREARREAGAKLNKANSVKAAATPALGQCLPAPTPLPPLGCPPQGSYLWQP